jgi:hypothetical protein
VLQPVAKFMVSDVPFSYCSQMLSKEVDACVTDLLKELVRFQDRMYQKDPVKAKTKRRLVLGLREVLKHLKLRKLKCIIISPNCEKIQSKGKSSVIFHSTCSLWQCLVCCPHDPPCTCLVSQATLWALMACFHSCFFPGSLPTELLILRQGGGMVLHMDFQQPTRPSSGSREGSAGCCY